VQRMSAGTGVTHSEWNHSTSEPVHFLQIWLVPEQRGIAPGYEQRHFAAAEKRGRLRLVASPDGRDGSVTLHADETNLAVDFGYRPATSPGTGTLGYWKTHPQAWPVDAITIGGVTYTKAQAIEIMDIPGRGDKTYDMFRQLVAAKLNVMIGNNSACIEAVINAADTWMTTFPLGSNVKSSSAAWVTGGPLHEQLDDYNNGRLCAPHRS